MEMSVVVKQFTNFLEKDRQLSPNTQQSYMRDIKQYLSYLAEIGVNSLAKTNKSTIITYILHLQKKGRATATISRNIASIRLFYQYMVNNKIIAQNPALELVSPKVEKKLPQVLSTGEVQLLLEQPKCDDLKGYRDKAMLELLYATGIRVSELIYLNSSDIDYEKASLICKHSAKNRTISINPSAMLALIDYINKSRGFLIQDPSTEALFVNVNGHRLTRQGFWKIIKQYRRQANINKEITPHTLRHSLATHLLRSGAKLGFVQAVMGHSDISSTQVYARIARNNENQ